MRTPQNPHPKLPSWQVQVTSVSSPLPHIGKTGKVQTPAAVIALLSILGFVTIIILAAMGIIPIGIGPLFFFLLIGIIIIALGFSFQYLGAKTLGFEEAFIILLAIVLVLFLLWQFGPVLLKGQFSTIQPGIQSLMSMVGL